MNGVTLVAAVARNGVIGREGALPWHLPDELKHFKRLTLDHAIVMGRKTWESLPGLLPRREHVVVTRNPDYRAEGARVAASLEDALAEVEGEAFVIGGAELFAAALPRAERLVITHVEADVEGDTFFPPVDWSAWRAVEESSHPRDERHAYGFRVVTYERASEVR